HGREIHRLAFLENCKYLKKVSVYANFHVMAYSIEYFHARIKEQIESWPVGVLADFARKRMKEIQNG
ncbi:MAG: hypothetical protein M0Z81_12680, partial [Deltaproteobacteria bacterium]|nr:hypothetical protein [Deltaproteobacteria bacterium]